MVLGGDYEDDALEDAVTSMIEQTYTSVINKYNNSLFSLHIKIYNSDIETPTTL